MKQILVVEDDPTLGRAVIDALKDAHFSATLAPDPGSAKKMVRVQHFDLAIVDMMLPNQNGVDLIKELHSFSPSLEYMLMSGVFKQSSVPQGSGPSIIRFLPKPFAVEELVQSLAEVFGTPDATTSSPINQLLSDHSMSDEEKLALIERLDTIHGFELPFVYDMLLNSNLNLHMTLLDNEGRTIGISFNKGQIIQLNLKDDTSYFGSILLEKGFINANDLREGLKATGQKRIGERLVDSNRLSPHAIQIALDEQMSIRLGKTIHPHFFKLSAVRIEPTKPEAAIDSTIFNRRLSEWVQSKISTDWLRDFFMPFSDNLIVCKQSVEDLTREIINHTFVQDHEKIFAGLRSGQSLQGYLDHAGQENKVVYQTLYYLLVLGKIAIDTKTYVQDYDNFYSRLQKIEKEMANKNHFEILSVPNDVNSVEVKRAFMDLAKVLHPDKLPQHIDEKVRTLNQTVFARINEAYNVLSEKSKRDEYQHTLTMGETELRLQAEILIEEARGVLKSGMSEKAEQMLVEASKKIPVTSELRLLILWARLKKRMGAKDDQFYVDSQDELNLIPPEDRYSPLYHFVKGLLYRMKGDTEGARSHFEHAIALDPKFIEAQREYHALKLRTRSQADSDTPTVANDLKSVMNFILGKKK